MTQRLQQFFAAGLCALALAPKAFADGDLQVPTFWFQAYGGYSVYKSEMVQSNDTSTTVGYGLGVYAGDERQLGMIFNREMSTFAFELNGSSLSLSWEDVHLRYRWGMLYTGVVLSSSSAWLVTAPLDSDEDGTLDADGDAEDYLDIKTQGMGGNFGLLIPINKRSTIYTDVTYVTTQTIQEKAPTDDSDTVVYPERPITVGPRMDADFGVSLKVTKSLIEARGGFKYRTYQLSVDGTAYAELLNTTYLGLQAGWYF